MTVTDTVEWKFTFFKRALSLDVLAPYASLYSEISGGEEHLLSAAESPDVKAGLRKVFGVSAATENILVITLADPGPTLLQKLTLVAASPVRQDVIEMYGANWAEPGNYVGNGRKPTRQQIRVIPPTETGQRRLVPPASNRSPACLASAA